MLDTTNTHYGVTQLKSVKVSLFNLPFWSFEASYSEKFCHSWTGVEIQRWSLFYRLVQGSWINVSRNTKHSLGSQKCTSTATFDYTRLIKTFKVLAHGTDV